MYNLSDVATQCDNAMCEYACDKTGACTCPRGQELGSDLKSCTGTFTILLSRIYYTTLIILKILLEKMIKTVKTCGVSLLIDLTYNSTVYY